MYYLCHMHFKCNIFVVWVLNFHIIVVLKTLLLAIKQFYLLSFKVQGSQLHLAIFGNFYSVKRMLQL